MIAVTSDTVINVAATIASMPSTSYSAAIDAGASVIAMNARRSRAETASTALSCRISTPEWPLAQSRFCDIVDALEYRFGLVIAGAPRVSHPPSRFDDRPSVASPWS
jgi:hypothetical protein